MFFTAVLLSLISGAGPKLIDEGRKRVESFLDGGQTSETVSDTDDPENLSVLRKRIDSLQENVDALKSKALDQATFASQMATRVDGLEDRVRLQLWGTVIALVIAITALVIVLV